MRAWVIVSVGLGVMGAMHRPEARAGRTPAPLGIFDDHGDVGVPSTIGPGTASYDPARREYTITGGGENMWARADHFHFVWKKMSGDLTLSATIAFTASVPASDPPVEHRKACLLIRQTLAADAQYADAAAHGNGMTALQWRARAGDVSHDIETNVVGPTRVRIEKRGAEVTMFVAAPGGGWRPAGGSTRIDFSGDVYVGLGVSSHSTSRLDTATFSDVAIAAPAPLGDRPSIVSTLETLSLGSRDRRVAYVSPADDRLGAPGWSSDATNTLAFTRGGRQYAVVADLPRAALNPAGPRVPQERGGPPGRDRRSPDGRTMVFAAERNGNIDIYAVPSSGGPGSPGSPGSDEKRLTSTPGADIAPEFSPDGQTIYFNSNRGGSMQVWRMKADGSEQEAITSGPSSNWYPHVAPNGQFVVFLGAPASAVDRLDRADVVLRRLTLADRAIDDLTAFYGGAGTLDATPFAPTSAHLTLVSYQRVAR